MLHPQQKLYFTGINNANKAGPDIGAQLNVNHQTNVTEINKYCFQTV
jgi:hypothetical protein